ncbi:hypothetical protein U1Q18_012146 [Sarracenia purpurea var. burkii]
MGARVSKDQPTSVSNFMEIHMLKSSWIVTLCHTEHLPGQCLPRTHKTGNVHLGGVAKGEESFMQICHCTMAYEAFRLHLAKFDPSEMLSDCHQLSGEWMHQTGVVEFHCLRPYGSDTGRRLAP